MTPPRRLLGLPPEPQGPERQNPALPSSPSATPPSVDAATGQSQQTEGAFYLIRGAQTLQQLHDDRDLRDPNSYYQTAQEQLAGADENNMGNYKTALSLLANLAPMVQNPQEQEALRADALRAANEALRYIRSGSPLRWAPDQEPMNLRDQSRYLFELAMNLGYFLHSQGPDALEDAHRQVLLNVYDEAFRLFEENNQQAENTRIPQAERPNPLPDYFGSYLGAQRALLRNQDSEAFTALLQTRQTIQELNVQQPNYTPGGIRDQIRFGTDVALWQFGRDTSAQDAQNVRTRFSLSALSYFYANQQISEGPSGDTSAEELQNQTLRQVQHFNLVASILLSDGLAGTEAQSFLEQFHGLSEEQTTRAGEIFQNQVTKNENLRSALSAMGFSEEDMNNAWPQLLENAQAVAGFLWEHRSEEPYQGILTTDGEDRPILEASNLLDQNQELRMQITQALSIPAELASQIQGRHMVEMLVAYGERLPTFLEHSLNETERSSETYQNFSEQVLQAAQGLREDGRRNNLELPLRTLVGHLRGLASQNDEYATPVAGFLNELAHTEQVLNGVELPETIRNESQRALENLTGFSLWRVFEHTFTWENLGMMALGSLAAELGSMWLLNRAGTAGTLGRGLLVNGGRIRPLGHLAVGFMVASSMSIGSSAIHSWQNEDYDFWTGENWGRIATGTAFATFAMAATMGFGHFLRGRMNIPAGQAPTIPQRLGLHLGTVGAGTVTMMGAGMASQRIQTGQWQIPTAENWAEMALSMWMWDRMGNWVWRPIFSRAMPRQMVGPYHMANTVDPRMRSILSRNPALTSREAFLGRHLASLFARGDFGTVVEGLEGDHYPVLEGEGRRQHLEWRAQDEFIAREGQSLSESSDFQRGLRQVIREARSLLEGRGSRPAAEGELAYILAERDGGNHVEFHHPSRRAEGQVQMRFAIDRHGNILETDGLSDGILRHALERIQEQRVESAAVTSGTSTDVFRRVQLIIGNNSHPLHRSIVRALTVARRALQEAAREGEENPEVYLRLRRQDNRLLFELIENSPEARDQDGILRVRERGYSNEEARRATERDRLLGLLLESIASEIFPDSVELPPPAGHDAGERADSEDATRAQPRAPRPRRAVRTTPAPRSPAPPPPPPPHGRPITATEPAEIARILAERYAGLNRSHLETAVEILRAKNFLRGLMEIRLELSSTSGSVATHPTIRVYRTENGEFHFMLEGTEAPAGEFWGQFRLARGRIIDVQSEDPVFRILTGDGRDLGAETLAMTARHLPEPTPERVEAEPEPVPEPQPDPEPDATDEPVEPAPAEESVELDAPVDEEEAPVEAEPPADVTQRRQTPAALIQRSQRSQRAPRGEPTLSMSRTEMDRHRQASRTDENPGSQPPEQPEEASFADVDLEELEDIPSPEAETRRIPTPPPLPGRALRPPSPPPPPSDPASQSSQQTSAVPEPASETPTDSEAAPIPLTRIRQRVLGIINEPTQVMDSHGVQELMTLVDQIENRVVTRTRGEDVLEQELAVVYDPEGEPMFEIMAPRMLQRMIENGSDAPGYFYLTRRLAWNEATSRYEQQRVVFVRSVGINRSFSQVLRNVFSD